ncbi:MAG TPA: HEAT repeat domain-containing protein [Planctomycetota bacterium]|nr:HEAT repeat domain-containing protein [Planctomycetota bacterium]
MTRPLVLVLALVLALDARGQEAPDKSVDCPTAPLPASRSGALYAALATARNGITLDDVLAATGYAFRATACANDCPCIEWREEATSIAKGARVFGCEVEEVDLARVPWEQAFGRIKDSIDAGRAVAYAGPRETGVIYGYRNEPRTFFVHAALAGEKKDEARPADSLPELWELSVVVPGKGAVADAAVREDEALLEALAYARRPPVRGGCGFLEAPALNGFGLSAYEVFAQKLASGDHGISGGHGAVPERVAHLRAGRAAAVTFLEKAAKRREAAKAGSGAALIAAAKEYRAELESALVPLESLTAGKDELALGDEGLRHRAASLLATAEEHDRAALALLEKPALERRVPEGLMDALSITRTAPVLEKLAPDLAQLAETGEADVRLLAVSALADTPGPAARAALGKALLDKDGPVSEAALVALEARNEEGLVDLLLEAWEKAPRTRIRSERPLQRQLVFSLADHAASDPRALKALEKALDDQGEGDETPDAIPRWAAQSLYGVEGVDAEPVLLAAMKTGRPTARRAAASVLDLSGSKTALAALEGALGDGDVPLRLICASALGRRGNEKGIKVAVAALKDPSRETRTLGVESLTRMGAAAVPAVGKLLQDTDWRVRANACVVLGRTGSTEDLRKIAALEKDPAPPVRELALQAKAIVEARARADKGK